MHRRLRLTGCFRYNQECTVKGTKTMNARIDNEGEGRVRCTFDLTKAEAAKLCDMRCEPKPSTAAAQVCRMAIKAECGAK